MVSRAEITITKLFNRHHSAGDYNHLTETQNIGILITQIIVYVLGGFLLLLWLFNFWNYIIKKERYKELSILLFYINAVFIIIEVLVDNANVPDTDFLRIQANLRSVRLANT